MRRIKKARISLLSLVPKGANKMPVIYKSDGEVEFNLLVKEGPDFDEKGELTAVVYAPEVRDAQGDIASADVVKEMAYSFMESGGQIDLQHDGKAVPRDRAFVAENFIVQKGDPRFEDLKDYDGNAVDPTDSWAVVIKILDPELRDAYRNGEWNGVSMFGTAEVQEEASKSAVVADRMAEALSQEVPVTKEELAQIVAETVAKTLAEAAPKQEEPKAEEKKVEKTDDFSPKALRERATRLRVEAIEKSIDPDDPDSIEAAAAEIEKIFVESTKPAAKQRAESRQPANEPVLKSDDDDYDSLVALGKEIAKAAGYGTEK